MNASRAAIKHLRGGAFITVASVVADFGTPLLGASACFKPYLAYPKYPPSGTNNLFTAGTGGRERSDRESALTRSIYTDVELRGGWTTRLIVIGLAALGVGYIARTRYSSTNPSRHRR